VIRIFKLLTLLQFVLCFRKVSLKAHGLKAWLLIYWIFGRWWDLLEVRLCGRKLDHWGGGALEVPIEIYVSSVFLSQLSQGKAGSSILHFLMVHCVTTDPKP
jgi:hypothetical protein